MKSVISQSIKTEFTKWKSEISNDLRIDVKYSLSESFMIVDIKSLISCSLQIEFAKLNSTFSITYNENLEQKTEILQAHVP